MAQQNNHKNVAVTEQIQTLDIEKVVQSVSITHEQFFAFLPLHCLFCHSQNSSFRALHQSSQQQTGTWVQEGSPCLFASLQKVFFQEGITLTINI